MANKKILLVDDDESLLASLGAGLQDEGYDIVTARNGSDAIEVFSNEAPDLVVLDLMLPEIDGISVCRLMRRSSPVPIIMLTAKKDEIDKIVGLEIGADDYVTKPFNFRELLARIKSALRRPVMEGYDSDEHAASFTLGELTIDYSRREVRIGERLVPLPMKEYDLLTLLSRKPGRVFEREYLLSQVWGDDFYGDEKTLDVHVRRLRAKIEPDPGNPRYILTIRGIGYRMAES